MTRIADRLARFGAWLMVVSLATGCHRSTSVSAPGDSPGLVWFADVTAASGVDFVHDAGPTGDYFFPQIVGSGAALFDFNNDGRLDILLLQNGGPGSRSTNCLFRQEPDGRFRDVSAGSGLDVAGYAMGAAVGDVN